jgi:hypothetical protein
VAISRVAARARWIDRGLARAVTTIWSSSARVRIATMLESMEAAPVFDIASSARSVD